MTARVRFAPSPTGRLHVGNARIALVNWLFARANEGRFLLRLDDTDAERSQAAFAEGIEWDLKWLGLVWDEFARQSDRLDRYAEAVERLKAARRLYPCYETPEELEYKRRRQLAAGKPPLYDRAALRLSDADRAKLEAEGRRPHWRFRLDAEAVEWTDLVRGPVRFQAGSLSDPVLVREDGQPVYTLASVVDDLELAVTHVIRGEDHVANTAVQIELFHALGGREPTFAHLSLLVDASGQGLSKRLGSLSLEQIRADGIEPMAVNSLLAKLGTSDPVEPRASLDRLVAEFDLSRFGRAAPRFDMEELKALNARLLHEMPFPEERLRALGLTNATARFWEAVRGNIARLDEARVWHDVCFSALAPVVADAEVAAAATASAPPEPWTEETWGAWTKEVAAATGKKGKALFLPLRLALTGREHGPELKALLPLIGRDRALARLRGETA